MQGCLVPCSPTRRIYFFAWVILACSRVVLACFDANLTHGKMKGLYIRARIDPARNLVTHRRSCSRCSGLLPESAPSLGTSRTHTSTTEPPYYDKRRLTHLAYRPRERDTVRRHIVLVLDTDDCRRRDAVLDPMHHCSEDVVLGVERERRRLLNAAERVRCLSTLGRSKQCQPKRPTSVQ